MRPRTLFVSRLYAALPQYTIPNNNGHNYKHSVLLSQHRAVSYFASKHRCLERWKASDSAVASEFHNGWSIVFVNKEVLMLKDDNTRQLRSHFVENRALKSLFDRHDSIEFSPAISALLDAVPLQTDSNDGWVEWTPVYAVGLKQVSESVCEQLTNNFGRNFYNVRLAMLTSAHTDARLVSKAQTLLRWSQIYKHCPKCARPLQMQLSKAFASCANCDRQYYAPVTPVAQCLIENPTSTHCLLVRHKQSLPGMFTCVAGFCEPGESLEEAAQRECAEELGIDIANLRYMCQSQHWPFPHSSMMLPFVCQADMQQQIEIDTNELRDAAWFSRTEIKRALDNVNEQKYQPASDQDRFWLIPPSGTSAHHTIANWLQAHGSD